jgi:serine/threonine protein kinase/tetratricopeptide (TPR) repeat protein
MGVVYRAHDEHLDRDVAIKLLSARIIADDGARKRFRKEALSLAKLNHPNVATVHEFGSRDGTDFLVTEYIPGNTLEGLMCSGPLPLRQIIGLGIQLAEGLSAAHDQGIVHSDLKPANLRLTPDERLKILDFGLARLVPFGSDFDRTATLTESQKIGGTLPYMSPEQLRGGAADTRTDIWAVGAVLYELATARRPFEEKVPAARAADIIHKAPEPPRKLRADLSPGLEAIILKCLEKDPAKRFRSARELQSELKTLSISPTPIALQRRWLSPILVGLGIAALFSLAFALYLRKRPVGSPPSSAIHVRRSVAVLGFKNLSGKPDAAWLSTALSEMLTTELAAGEKLRTVSGENVARTRLDLSLPEADSYAPDTLARIRKNLGADFLVIGSFYDAGSAAGGQIRLDLRLQDAAAGETIASVSQTGTENGLLDLVSRVGVTLREKLGVGEVSTSETAGLRASLPRNAEITRLYSEGLAKLRVFDALAARALFEKATQADPAYAPAFSVLAAAWSELGFDARAQEAAKRAFDLSGNLSREERLSIEGNYYQMARDWDKAVAAYRSLWSSFPDNLDYGLRLMAAQVSGGHGQDALTTLGALRSLPPPTREDPRIDLAEVSAAESLGDFKRALQAASSAAEKGEAQGARLLVARALNRKGWASDRLGDMRGSTSALEQARSIFAVAGDIQGVASTQDAIGGVLYDKGDLDGAKKLFEESLARFRESGNRKGMARAYNSIANVLYDKGDLQGAKKMYERALPLEREIGSSRGIAGVVGNLANVLDSQGDLAGARRMNEEALKYFGEAGDKRGMASTLSNLGNVLYEMGALDDSKKMYAQADSINQVTGYKRGMAYQRAGMSVVLSAQDELTEARKNAEQALAIRTELGDQWNIAASRAGMAGLLLDEGHPAAAETMARQAAEDYARLKATDNLASADSVLARSLLVQGKTREAQKVVQDAQRISARSAVVSVHLEVDTIAASVRAAAAGNSRPSESAAAKKSLEAVLTKATKHGYVGYAFESRLALGEVELKLDRTSATRAQFASLEEDARAKGFLLIARKAAAKVRGAGTNP